MKTITFRLVTYLKYSLIFTMLFGIGNLYAQSTYVSGTVTHNGEPLMGVVVHVKGTERGTVTDIEGQYALGLLIGEEVIFSHVGFQSQEIKFINETQIDVELVQDIQTLNAVEISGYYSLEERSRTGSVTKVDTDQLDKQVVHSPMEALQGRVAGLEIETITGLRGQAPLVTLRGQSSLRGKLLTQPLYIIDGVPIDNSSIMPLSQIYNLNAGVDPLATLDPSLIESIEVLKDADATAIYGSRGANGVIIINTKRGQAGKTKFEVQAETGVSWVGKFMKLMNTDEYLEMRREAFENDGVTPTESNAPDLLLWDQNRYTDWQKELIGGNAEFQKYQASVSGGNDQTSFLLSGGFQKESTVFPGDFGFQNNNLHGNINHVSQDNRFQINTSVNYGYRKSKLFDAGIFVGKAILLSPNAPRLFDDKGNVNWEIDEHGNPTFSNPMGGIADPNTMRIQSLQWNGNITYRLLKGLEAKINLGMNQLQSDDKQNVYKKNVNPLQMATTRSTALQRKTGRNHFIIEPQLHYNISFDKHTLSSLVGTTYQKNNSSVQFLRGQGYFSESQVGNIALAEDKNILVDDNIEYRYTALFGRIGYSFANKYHLNLTGRRDGSSRFGENNRFGNFGAIGLAWEFYKEDFVKEFLPAINYGKFRSSYGTTGSDNIGDYQYLDTYRNITLAANSKSLGGIVPSRLHNPYYQWEKNTKLEFATDVSLWENKMQLSVSWHREQSSNQLIGLTMPSITGFSTVQGNFPATVQNTGWEFVAQFNPIQTNNFNWSFSINFTLPTNKLLKFPELESSSYASAYEVGKSLSIQKLYHFIGVDPDTGKYVFDDVNEDGVINIDDRVVLKDLSRKFYGGWYNDIRYKNWNLSFLFEFVKQNGRSYLSDFGSPGGQPGITRNVPIEFLDVWSNQGDDAAHQKYTQNFDMGSYNYFMLSEKGIEDASFIRLKSLSLNYQLPHQILQNIGIQQGQVYLNAQNLFTITPYKGLDPQSAGRFELPALTSIYLGFRLTI